jgi:hypothetical protein
MDTLVGVEQLQQEGAYVKSLQALGYMPRPFPSDVPAYVLQT